MKPVKVLMYASKFHGGDFIGWTRGIKDEVRGGIKVTLTSPASERRRRVCGDDCACGGTQYEVEDISLSKPEDGVLRSR